MPADRKELEQVVGLLQMQNQQIQSILIQKQTMMKITAIL